jgi:hypothetical protein
MIWTVKHPRATADMLGFLPDFLSESDPRPAKEQIDMAYGHGGGWNSFYGFTMLPSGDIAYSGDPPTRLLYEAKLRSETIRFYEHAWVAILQQDGSYEIARID